MKLRLMTRAEVPFFSEHGIQANSESWTTVDLEKLSAADRRGLVSAHKRILLVHEADEKAFADLKASLKYEGSPEPAPSDGDRAPTQLELERYNRHLSAYAADLDARRASLEDASAELAARMKDVADGAAQLVENASKLQQWKLELEAVAADLDKREKAVAKTGEPETTTTTTMTEAKAEVAAAEAKKTKK